jgi:hypothetical protein
MTPQQQTALEALVGRALTQAEVEQIAPLVAERSDGAVAAALSAGRMAQDATTKFTSLGISERFPALGGLPGPLAAELVFQKLEGFATAAMASQDPATKLLGGATARQMDHLKGGGMAIGSPAVAAMLAVIVAAPGATLTQAEVDALVGVATVPAPISTDAVSRALNNVGA